MTIDVIVIEDDAATREALCRAVIKSPSLRLVGSAGSLAAASALLAGTPCSVVLMDLDLNGESSVELIAQLTSRSATQVLVISALGDEASVIAAIQAGADGYLLKEGAMADLETPITQLIDGQSPLSPGIARYLLRKVRPEAPKEPGPGAFHLTPRERQVLVLFAQGASYKEVARTFDISLHTVRDHVKALYRKLRAHSRGVAVRRALQSGLIGHSD